jgi:hypothetical protein
VGFDNEYVSVARIAKEVLRSHPWSLGGGGVGDLKQLLEARADSRLGSVVDDIGFSVIVGEEDVFTRPIGAQATLSLPRIQMVRGEAVRDWSLSAGEEILRPFDPDTLEVKATVALRGALWPWKRTLEQRVVSGSATMKESNRAWFDVRRLSREKHKWPLSIAFAFVATHNHFVLDRGGKVFGRTAPIIKLPENATEEDHLALIGYLNSSTACFWMKQVCQPKGSTAVNRNHPDPARMGYEFAGTALGQLPVPNWSTARDKVVAIARELTMLASRRAACLRDPTIDDVASCSSAEDWRGLWLKRWREHDQLRQRLVFLQEELDWTTYAIFGLAGPETLTGDARDAGLRRRDRPGFRDAESMIRRDGAALDSVEAEVDTAPPPHYSCAVQSILELRHAAIAATPELQLLESPVFKRLWRDTEDNIAEAAWRVARERAAAASALVNMAEGLVQRREQAVALTRELAAAAPAWTFDAACADARTLVESESVPYLAANRYTEAGLEKRAAWERTWDLQRLEDAGEKVGEIPVPPKYDPKEFRGPSFYRLRGTLDVPKERFISYPGCEGWNHLQQAQALAALYQKRKVEEGWAKERLVPMLAGLNELVPWVIQWHNEPSAEFGGMRLGDYFRDFVSGQCQELGVTLEQVRAWRPQPKASRRRGAQG